MLASAQQLRGIRGGLLKPLLKVCKTRVPLVRVNTSSGTKNEVATKGASGETDDCDYNIGEYCTIDSQGKRMGKRSLGEMEQEFIQALSSFYFDNKPIMTNEEFENLKEELLWAGSTVAILDANEKRFLEASLAYSKGQPIMSDEEYDELKAQLRQGNSIVAAQGPRCSIRTKKMYSDCSVDYARTTLLNLPGALMVLGVIFAMDFAAGNNLARLVTLPVPYGIALLWGLLLPTCYVISTAITNVAFKDGMILKGSCPNCGADNTTYFGSIFTVPGNRGQNVVDCSSCNASLTFDEFKRIIVVSETPEEKAKKAAEAAAKKNAAAAKRKAAAAAK